MGAFSNLFATGDRKIPRIAVIEIFAEHPDTPLTAPEVERMSEVSRRAVYMIIKDFVEEGILVQMPPEKPARSTRYALNPHDLRAETLKRMEVLLTIGQLEAEIKRDEGVPQGEMWGGSIMVSVGKGEDKGSRSQRAKVRQDP